MQYIAIVFKRFFFFKIDHNYINKNNEQTLIINSEQ